MPSRTSTPAVARQRSPRWRGQRFAGGDGKPQTVGAGAAAISLCASSDGVERGHAEEDRRPMPAHHLEHRVRRRPLRQQHCCGADRHRERHGVAHAVGEEELRRRKDDVVLANADHALPHQPRRGHQRRVDVLDALRFPGRTGRVHPERDFVRQRRRGEHVDCPRADEIGKIANLAAPASAARVVRAAIDENDCAQTAAVDRE